MKQISLILVILGLSWKAFPQEPISLPLCVTQLEQSQPFFQKIIREQIATEWHAYYGYSPEYSRAILDTLPIFGVPRLLIDIERYPHRNFFDLDSLLASLILCDHGGTSSQNLLSATCWYFEGKCPDYFMALDSPTRRDSLAHLHYIQKSMWNEAVKAVRKMGYKVIFDVVEMGAWWLIMPDNSLIIYDLQNNIFCDPQKYLDRERPKTAESQADFDFILRYMQDFYCNPVEDISQETKKPSPKVLRRYQKRQKRMER